MVAASATAMAAPVRLVFMLTSIPRDAGPEGPAYNHFSISNPNAYKVLSAPGTNTVPAPAERPAVTGVVIARPLVHNCLPLDASNAYSTAGALREPRDTANSTPLTTSGGSGEAISCDDQPGWNDGLPPSSASLNDTIPR